jgi:hypothetical protein
MFLYFSSQCCFADPGSEILYVRDPERIITDPAPGGIKYTEFRVSDTVSVTLSKCKAYFNISVLVPYRFTLLYQSIKSF